MTTETAPVIETPTEQTPEQVAAAQAAAAAAAGVGGKPTLNVATGEGTPPPEKPTTKADEVVPVQYQPSGDAGLDMLLDAAGGLGLGPDHPAMAAAINGDFDLLAVELAKGDVKGHDRLIALGVKSFADTQAKTAARQAADLKAVHEEAGGEESWKAVQTWAHANADEGEIKAIRAQLQAGGLQARMAAAWLTSVYNRANNVVTDGPGKAVSEAKGAAASNAPLSPRDYGREVLKARQGFKGDFEKSQQYRDLQARRMAWRG